MIILEIVVCLLVFITIGCLIVAGFTIKQLSIAKQLYTINADIYANGLDKNEKQQKELSNITDELVNDLQDKLKIISLYHGSIQETAPEIYIQDRML